MNLPMSMNMDIYTIMNSFMIMLIPGITGAIFSYIKQLIDWVIELAIKKYKSYQYTYSLKYIDTPYYFNGKEELHKALKYYVSQLDIVSPNTEINLDSIREKSGNNMYSTILKKYKLLSLSPLFEEYTHIEDNIYVIVIKKVATVQENKQTFKETSYQIDFNVYDKKLSYIQQKQRIEQFIKKIMDKYIEYLQSNENNNKLNLFYQYIHDNNIAYKCIELNNKKTFDALFIPNKQKIMKLVSQANDPANLNKLGLLLHGIAGSGKSSLIKAISNYTNRHIIYINLNNIKTNKDFMTVLTQTDYTGSNIPIPFAKKIFVFEDIDCASDIIKKRELQLEIKTKEKTESEDKEDKPKPITDALTLSGILNMLDGIIDTPNRIVIMTTNHVEHLDSALIRPGRIDRIINLGHIQSTEAVQMLEYHYKQELTVDQQIKVNKLLETNHSPAQLECMCNSNGSLEEFFDSF